MSAVGPGQGLHRIARGQRGAHRAKARIADAGRAGVADQGHALAGSERGEQPRQLPLLVVLVEGEIAGLHAESGQERPVCRVSSAATRSASRRTRRRAA